MARGVVKFFNGEKGFGFITPYEGGEDVFLHVSAMRVAQIDVVNEGDVIDFELSADMRSGRSTAGRLVVIERAPPWNRPSSRPFKRPVRERLGPGEGVVKWFNTDRGFGFVQPDDGGGDVFIHISALERAGLSVLAEGVRIAYELETDARSGRTCAVNLRPM